MFIILMFCTFLFWTFNQTFSMSGISLHNIDVALEIFNKNSVNSTEASEQKTLPNYKLQDLFLDADLNGIPSKKVIIKIQINGNEFKIDNENPADWDSVNELVNNEIKKRNGYVLLRNERLSNNSNTDIIRLIDTTTLPKVVKKQNQLTEN